MSYAEKGTKSTTEISVNGDVIDFKGKNIVDEMQLDGKSLGKLTYNNELGHIDANALNALIESFIEAGHQSPGRLDELVYGKSITDSCVSWERTNELLHTLSAAIRERRALH